MLRSAYPLRDHYLESFGAKHEAELPSDMLAQGYTRTFAGQLNSSSIAIN
jgi:hypothetical protein